MNDKGKMTDQEAMARFVSMQIPPSPFDPIVIGTVGRKKVKLHPIR